ncbi:MAG: hypothetical protein QGG53_02580 [Planctomycetota bacterium]|jgi:hypothetical protein|nr:hypothetical protein [Planctomycetota bacterium]
MKTIADRPAPLTENDRKMVQYHYAVQDEFKTGWTGHDGPNRLERALTLLLLDREKHADEANELLREWASLQNRDPRSLHYGMRLDPDQPTPEYDTGEFPPLSLHNAFSAPTLGILYRRFWDVFDEQTKADVLEACRAGLFEFLQRDLALMGANQPIGMTAGLIVYGTLTGLDALVKKGVYRLQHYLQLSAYGHPQQEYNSPTYIHPTVAKIACAAFTTDRPDIAVLCRLAAEWNALVGALHYHAPTAELGGPFYRAYYATLRRYAGGFNTFAFKTTGDSRHLDPEAHPELDSPFQVQMAACGDPWSRTIRSIMTDKRYPYQMRQVFMWKYPSRSRVAFCQIDTRDAYVDHNLRSAQVGRSMQVAFDEGQPLHSATCFQTETFALGSMSTFGTGFGHYGTPFHRMGSVFHYRPHAKAESRFGIIAGTNTDEPGDRNRGYFRCRQLQEGRVVLGLYEIDPAVTHRAEMFMTLPCSGGEVTFRGDSGQLAPGDTLEPGAPMFIEHGEFYGALIPSPKVSLSVCMRTWSVRTWGPHETSGYGTVPCISHVFYDGETRTFAAHEKAWGSFAFVCGDRATDGPFEDFRESVFGAAFTVEQNEMQGRLSLRGFGKQLDAHFPAGDDRVPEPGRLFVDGDQVVLEGMIADLCRHRASGEPFTLGEWRFNPHGSPVCVAIAPDGLSWIVYQPVNRCVTFEATRSTGGLRIAKLPQGRTELRLDGNEPRLVCDTVMPPSDCEGWGGLENITIEQLAPAR